MDWYSHIPIGTITLFSMLVLGLTLFPDLGKNKMAACAACFLRYFLLI